MPRPKGARNRPKGESCTSLRAFIQQEKERIALETGCVLCGEEDQTYEAHRLCWITPPGYPRVVDAPHVPGMTRERLEEIIAVSQLVCHPHKVGWVNGTAASKRKFADRTVTVRTLDLTTAVNKTASKALVQDGPPEFIVVRGVRYKRTYEEES